MKLRLQFITLALFAFLASAMADKVNLNFYADGDKVLAAKVEANQPCSIPKLLADSGVTITGCRNYTFAGWKTGGPVVGDETPTLEGDFYTPQANVNFYAVYERTSGPTNRYVRVTSTSDLHAGSQYLIVCYYEWDGETYYGPSYWALGNVQSETPYVYQTGDYADVDGYGQCPLAATRYLLSAEQIHPDAGAVNAPANSIVWTLSGTVDAWKWTNESASATLNIGTNYASAAYGYNGGWYMYPDANYNENLLDDALGGTCSVTASNGVFNFISGDYRLTYSDDDADYFQTGISNNWSFYLYKKESPYTSFPDCEKWTVNLDAGDGKVNGKDTVHLHEASAGAGVLLPSATKPSGVTCEWTFAGWSVETPIKGQQSPQNGKNNAPALISNNTTYKPVFDGETLYAVYEHNVGTEVYYERITNKSDLRNGDVCVIATAYDDYAVTYVMKDRYYFYEYPITVINGEIRSTVEDYIQWTYDGTYFKHGTTYLSYEGKNQNRYSIYNADGPEFTLSFSNYGNRYYLRETQYDDGYYFTTSSRSTSLYIYKRKTRPITTYTSYPHCALYKVHLHACGGTMTVGTNKVTYLEKTEDEGTFGVVLPKPEPLCPDSGWVFLGWLEGGELDAIEDVDFTGLIPAGDRFKPSHDNIHLYAVYKRFLKKFRRIVYPYNMVPGDKYVLSYYGDGSYQWELSSDTKDADHLAAIRGEERNDAGGAYIEVSNPKAMWTLGGDEDAWTFKDSLNGKFLKMTTDGKTSLDATGTEFKISRVNSQFVNLSIYVTSGSDYYYLHYDGNGKMYTSDYAYGLRMDLCMLYRQMREYASWPHCDPFTVNFDGCGGNEGVSSLTEDVAYDGVVLPNAYVNSDCRKEGWTFLGWSRSPITEESDVLTKDLIPAGTVFHPTMNNSTLYAVYCFKDSKYKRITSVEDLRTGVNYIIAVGNNAMSNTPTATNYVDTKSVTPVGNVITSEDEAIEWRVQGIFGSYELYNVAADLYLDLRTEGSALLTADMEDNFYISYTSGKFVVRSNRNRSDWEGLKYLGYDGTNSRYNTADKDNQPTLYFYQQEAIYHSFPECVSGIEALRWTIENDSSFVYVESYQLKNFPEMDGAIGDARDYVTPTGKDGSVKIKYSPTVLHPRDTTPITWDGTTAHFVIPYVLSTSANLSSLNLPDNCRNCDVVVMPEQTLTIDVNNKSVHNLMLHEDAQLIVSNFDTLKVNSLILRVEDDKKMPTINLNSSGAISLTNKEIIFDARIDENRWYWYSLPFNTQVQGISYSNIAANGKSPVFQTDFWLKNYNGKLRADDANGGALADTYWQHVTDAGKDYTLEAGRGHIIGIADQASTKQLDNRFHTKRVMRFFMSQTDKLSWNDQERADKHAPVVASQCSAERNKVHAGWNLIGNPYMHEYEPGTTTGIKTGEWEKVLEDGKRWWQVKSGTESVPYLTLYHPDDDTYSQVLAATATVNPFVAVFVQINAGSQVNFTSAMNVSGAPAYRRFVEPETPLYTGILLHDSNNAKSIDRTGIVLNEEYTLEYEIGGDLVKYSNAGKLNLYTINKYDQELAFNGLSDEDAIAPIPVGVAFPAAGEYTFAFDAEQYSSNALDTLQLIDKQLGTVTDLLTREYTFTQAQAAKVDNRFEILVRRAKAPQIVTNLDETYDADKPRKVIRDGILYIIRDDKMYNALGAEVK